MLLSRGLEEEKSPDKLGEKKPHDPEFRLYRFLLSKYADLINDFEKKTVGEIKALIDPNNLSVQSLVADFRKEGYAFEKDFLQSAEKAFEFVQSELMPVKTDLDLNFWLSPKEILHEKLGDDKDLSVFLCTLLSALGDEKAEVIVAEMTDGKNHAFVMTEFFGKFYIFDPNQKHAFDFFAGQKSEVLEKYSANEAKISRFLYRFNRHNYEQFM